MNYIGELYIDDGDILIKNDNNKLGMSIKEYFKSYEELQIYITKRLLTHDNDEVAEREEAISRLREEMMKELQVPKKYLLGEENEN